MKMPVALRARLLLRRDLAIHMLSRRRHAAIRDGLANNHRPQLSLDNFTSEHAALVARTITDAYHSCPQAEAGLHQALDRAWSFSTRDQWNHFLSLDVASIYVNGIYVNGIYVNANNRPRLQFGLNSTNDFNDFMVHIYDRSTLIRQCSAVLFLRSHPKLCLPTRPYAVLFSCHAPDYFSAECWVDSCGIGLRLSRSHEREATSRWGTLCLRFWLDMMFEDSLEALSSSFLLYYIPSFSEQDPTKNGRTLCVYTKSRGVRADFKFLVWRPEHAGST